VPQIAKLCNSSSSEGVSFTGYLLETASLGVSLVYNIRNHFPFSSYGETAFILIQNVAICFLVLEFSGKGNYGSMLIAALAGAGFMLFNSDIVDMELLQYLQIGAGVVGAASKLPQILAIFREGGTGQLSAFTVSRSRSMHTSICLASGGGPFQKKRRRSNMLTNSSLSPTQVFSYLFGSASRVFTTIQEVPDNLILYGFLAGFALNLVLALQMAYYWNAPASKNTPEHKLTPAGKREIKEPIERASEKVKAQTTGSEKKGSPSTRRRG